MSSAVPLLGGVGRCGQKLTSGLRRPITARCGSLTQLAAPGVNADKLDALLAQTSTSKQDVSLFADMLSLPNDGRYPTLEALATSTLRRSRRAAAKLLTRDGSPAHRRQSRQAAEFYCAGRRREARRDEVGRTFHDSPRNVLSSPKRDEPISEVRSSAQPISSPAVRSAATSASSRALSRRTCVFSHAAMVKSRRADSSRLAASFDFSD